jgi:hypothetical protein
MFQNRICQKNEPVNEHPKQLLHAVKAKSKKNPMHAKSTRNYHYECELARIYVKKIIADGFKIYFWPAKNFMNWRYFRFSSLEA